MVQALCMGAGRLHGGRQTSWGQAHCIGDPWGRQTSWGQSHCTGVGTLHAAGTLHRGQKHFIRAGTLCGDTHPSWGRQIPRGLAHCMGASRLHGGRQTTWGQAHCMEADTLHESRHTAWK
jgi:hypothetical protein